MGTLQHADLGAEVIKVEDPASGGDVSRYVPPFAQGDDSLFFETFNRNKKERLARPAHAGGPHAARGASCAAPTSSTRTCAATSPGSSS